MKKIYIVGGTMGVGKTTVCQKLKELLPDSVFLDGDWCWDMSPFKVTEETKAMVMDNICYILNNYIHFSAFNNIIFCWVMHEQRIIDDIVSALDTRECEVKIISLICGEQQLRKRLQKDIDARIRQRDILERSIARLPLYESLDTIKIDVSDISAEQTAKIISEL
ncbi:MAG: AAA family ATPase [Monoglobales bacterium]